MPNLGANLGWHARERQQLSAASGSLASQLTQLLCASEAAVGSCADWSAGNNWSSSAAKWHLALRHARSAKLHSVRSKVAPFCLPLALVSSFVCMSYLNLARRFGHQFGYQIGIQLKPRFQATTCFCVCQLLAGASVNKTNRDLHSTFIWIEICVRKCNWRERNIPSGCPVAIGQETINSVGATFHCVWIVHLSWDAGHLLSHRTCALATHYPASLIPSRRCLLPDHRLFWWIEHCRDNLQFSQRSN